jgi:hypothetical protein
LVPPDSFLEDISYRDNNPVFQTKEFSQEQRRQVIALGFDLYRERIVKFRLGRFLGGLVYWITKAGWIDKLATNFALNNPLGRRLYIGLSRKSFMTKEELK